MARLLGDGSLKEDYDSLLRVRHAEDNAQIEKDDQLAVELLREEEAQLLTAQERRAAMLLEDTQIAVDLALRLKSEAAPTASGSASSHNITATLTQTRGSSSGGDGKQRHNRGSTSSRSRQKPDDKLSHQKNGILHYFNTNSSHSDGGGENSNSQGSSQPSSTSSSSSSREEGADRKRALDLPSNAGTTSSSSSSSSTLPAAKKQHYVDSDSKSKVDASPRLNSLFSSQSSVPMSDSAFSSSPICTTSPHHQSQLQLQLQSPTPTPASSQPVVTPSWNCTVCTFSNYGLLAECEMCGEKKKKRREGSGGFT
jgi:hypothetical protein